MSRKEKKIFLIIEIALCILTIVSLNDSVISVTSGKITPVLVMLMFVNLLIALTKNKDTHMK